MELSRERLFREYIQSKLLGCEQACAALKNDHSALEERWQPKGLHMEQREDEAKMIHEALKGCIKGKHNVECICDILEDEILILENNLADLEMYNKDSEKQIKAYTARIEGIQKDNEKVGRFLCHAEKKIKELGEMNSSMLLKYHGSESVHSASASASGK